MSVLTRVNANAYLQLQLRLVLDGETFHCVQNGQRHQSDFARMIVAVALRQSGHHHVRVADGLDLGGWAVVANDMHTNRTHKRKCSSAFRGLC